MPAYRTKPRSIIAARCAELIALATICWGSLPTWFRAAYERGDVLIGANLICLRMDDGSRQYASDVDYIACDETGALRAVEGRQFEATYELEPAG